MSSLDYRIEIQKLSDEDGGGYLASAPSLPGCISDGESPEEALTNIQDAIKAWIETSQELGRTIPAPDEQFKPYNDYSGKLSLRIPKYLHKKIAERAHEEDISINQLIQSYISYGVGFDHGLKSIFEYYKDKNQNIAVQTVIKQWDAMQNKDQDYGLEHLFNYSRT